MSNVFNNPDHNRPTTKVVIHRRENGNPKPLDASYLLLREFKANIRGRSAI